MELKTALSSDLGDPTIQDDVSTDHFAYAEVCESDVHASARVLGLVQSRIDRSVDDGKGAVAWA